MSRLFRERGSLVTDTTVLVILTDGHANVPTRTDDPWADVLTAARTLRSPAIVIDSEDERQPTGRPRILADTLGGTYLRLSELDASAVVRVLRGTP